MASQTFARQGPSARQINYRMKNARTNAYIDSAYPQTVPRASVSYINTIEVSILKRTETPISVSNNNPAISNDVYLKNFAKITRRKFELINRACIYNDIMVGLAIGGLILAIVLQQLITDSKQVFDAVENITYIDTAWVINNFTVLFILRGIITLSTISLAGLNLAFQMCTFKLQMLSTSRRSTLVLLRAKQVALTALELVLCAIHPLPYDFAISQTSVLLTANANGDFFGSLPVNVNVYPTLFMFVRFYLVARCFHQHHVLYRTRITHLFGRVDNQPIGYSFIIRCMMEENAGLIMICIIAVLWLGGAWGIQCCEWNSNSATSQYMNSLWLVIITFFTVSRYKINV